MSRNYTYTKEINLVKLEVELRLSAMQAAPISVTQRDGVTTVSMETALSPVEAAMLDNLVSAHDGAPVTVFSGNEKLWNRKGEARSASTSALSPYHLWNTPVLENGEYRLSWFCHWDLDSKNSAITIEIRIGNKVLHTENLGRSYRNGTKHPLSGFTIIDIPEYTTHTISLYYSVDSNKQTATLFDNIFELEKAD